MKHLAKRSLSGLMVLILLVSLFSGISFTASAATGTLVSNTGTRHSVSTSLSTQAEAYYTGDYTYANLSALAVGNASCQDTMDSAMFQALSALMTDTMTKTVSYDSLVDYWPETDANNGSSDAVLFYSDVVSSSYNREHVWPKSRGSFKESRAGSDLHHLRPTNTNVNSTRGNHTMGNVVGVVSSYSTYQYSGSDVLYYNASYTSNGCQGIVEVNDNIKGDVARILLYVWCRWQEPNLFENISDPVVGSGDDANNGYKVIESLDTLLQWCEMDPVDEWEMGRNDQCENVQGNRNVFIDYPEFAWLLFDQEMPADMSTPSGEAANSSSAYTITAVSNNTAWGTVSLSGRKITAVPAEGYYASGYTVTSGTATVTQSGNTFTVSAASDCTVRIDFAAKTAVSVSYSVPAGVSQSASTGYAGEAITLPTPTGTPTGDYDYAFVGWTTASMASDSETCPTVYAAGSEYIPTGNTTLYAVYSYLVSDGTGVSGEYTLVTAAPADWSGTYVIASTDSSVLMTNTASSSYLQQASITITDNTISTTDEGHIWTLSRVGSYYTIQDSTGAYLKSTSTKTITLDSSVTSVTESDTAYLWTPSVDGIAHYSTGNLQYNSGSPRFTTYTSSQKTAYLFSGISGTTWYTTNISTCEHNWVAGAVVEPTCTEGGYTPYTCSLCGASKQDNATNALGHSYGDWASDNAGNHSQTCTTCGGTVTEGCSYGKAVTDPTETEQGYTTYTCDTCGHSYVDDYVAALGSPLTVSFSVPNGVDAVEAQTAYSGNTIILPEATGTPTDNTQDYTFLGWVAATVTATETRPEILTAGSEYTVTADATLYALYSYAVSDSGSGTAGTFELITSAPSNWAGEYVLTTADAAYVFLADGTTPNKADAAKALADTGITLSGTTLSGVSDSYIIVIEAVGDNYSLRLKGSADTLYLMTSNSNSGFNTASSTDATTAQWTLAIASDGSVTITNASYTSRSIRFNSSSKQFRTYTSGQAAVYLYGGSSASTWYTTELGGACAHANVSATAATEPSCETAGNIAYWYCADCDRYYSDAACTTAVSLSSTVISATGHSYTGVETTAATCTTDGLMTYTCGNCGHSYTELLSATGHSWDEGVTTTAPTATEAGVKTYTCTLCGETKTEVIPALGEKVNYTLVSSITSGTEYIMAFNYNGTYYAISYNGGYTLYKVTPVDGVISLEQGEAFLWKINAVTDGYTISNGTSYISGTTSGTTLSYSATACTWAANAGQATGTFWFQVGTRGIGLQSGTTVKNYAVSNATNTGVEYDFDIYLFANSCSHANTSTERVEADCTTNGYERVTCDDCGAELSYTTLLQGHDYVEASRTEATCTTDGSIYYECSRCDSTKSETVAALGHTEVIDAAVAATCTESGLTQGSHCSVCGTVTLAQEAVEATGHSWTLTETTATYELYTCSVCGETKTAYFRTISFSAPEGITAIEPVSAAEGTVITLPTPEGTLTANAYDYSFVGWTAAEVADSTEAGDYLAAGAEYTVSSNVTLYALYSYASDASYGGEGSFVLLTDASLLKDGWKVVILSSGYTSTMALGADYGSSDTNFDGRTVTVTNNTVTPDSTVQVFTVVMNDDGTISLLSDLTDSGNNGYYLAASSNTSNDICVKTFTDAVGAEAKWTLTIGEDTLAKLTAGTYERNTILFNSTNGGLFSCYGETYLGSESQPANIYGINLYASNVVAHYTTAPKQTCEHESITWTDNGDGTCTGTCDNGCGYSATQAHDTTTEVTQAATCTEAGTAESTCANCGNVTETVIDATGHGYTSEVTTQPTCTAEGVTTYTCTACGDSYTESAGYAAHDYVDGTCTVCGAKAYTRVNETLSTWAGEYIIVYELDEANGYAFDGINDAANNFASGTFLSDGMISLTDADSYMITIEAVDGGYTIKNAAGNYFTYSENGNDFTTGTTATVYTIEFSETDGILIKNANGAVLRFNASANMFRFYKTTSYGTQKKVWLYEKAGSCHHVWEQTDAIEATCDDNGLIQYTCSVCGGTKEEFTDPLGHDYLYNTVDPTCLEEGYTEVTCSRCTYEDIPDYSIVAALGHDYSVLPEVTDEEHYIAPTCTEAGLACMVCSRCGAFDAAATELPATGHSYVNGVCTVCGDALDPIVFTLLTDTTFDGVTQVLLVMEYEGAYYAMSATANGSMLVGTPVTVTNDTVTIYADGTYTIFTPVLDLSDGTNTGLGFMTGEDYLHVNSGTLKVTTSTGNAALAVSQAQVWTGTWDESDNLVMEDVENAWFLQGIATSMYISNLDSDSYTCSDFGVYSDSFYAVPIYFYGLTDGAIIDPVPCNVIYHEGTPATCTESGTMSYYTCADPSCEHYGKMYADESLTQELTDLTVAPTGHVNTTTEAVAATCTENGSMTVTCTDCGAVVSTEVIAATGHNSSYTDNGDGTHDYTCSVCGTVEIDNEAHTFTGGTCVCGVVEGPVAAADLIFYRKTLSLQSYIAFNLTAKNSILGSYDSWYVVFERYDHLSGAVVTETVEGTAYGTSYQLFEYKVSSYQMTDDITATLYAVKDGITYKGEVYTDSIENFVVSRMAAAAASSADMATLYANLLTYGSKAQQYLGYNTAALADAKLGEYASYVTATVPTAEDLSAETSNGLTGATKDRLALGIAAAVQIQLRIVLDSAYDVNNVYGLMTYERDGQTITQRIEGTDFTKSGSKYILIFDGITAVDGRAPVDITIYDANGTAISETWTYSISSYLVAGGLSGIGLETMQALLNYFDSAAVVFG